MPGPMPPPALPLDPNGRATHQLRLINNIAGRAIINNIHAAQVLDDIVDHWGSTAHRQEKADVVHMLQVPAILPDVLCLGPVACMQGIIGVLSAAS
jgi:hypothetical protein